MDADISTQDVLYRLAASLAAGMVIGFDRGEHGRPAGLRTCVLVCVTAAASMVLANLLMDTRGRPADSYVRLDMMRLPLGVLTGVGFIGAGAILHKGDLVMGVTTAATLWFATVMGFFYGVGEYGYGAVLTGLGLFVLAGLRFVDDVIPRRHRGVLVVRYESGMLTDEALEEEITEGGRHRIVKRRLRTERDAVQRRYDVVWHARENDTTPGFVRRIEGLPGVRGVEWR